MHQKLTRSSRSAAHLALKDTFSIRKGIPNHHRVYTTLLDPGHQGGACPILIVLLLGHLQWSCFFSQRRFGTQGLKFFKPSNVFIQELEKSVTPVCMRALITVVTLAVLVHPATAGAEVICEPLSPRPASNQALSPPTEGKVKPLLGHVGRLCKNIGGLSALA